MIADYKEAAKQLGVTVQAVQGVTWYIWKTSQYKNAREAAMTKASMNSKAPITTVN